MEKARSAPVADPLRWTYAGDLDDMVTQYPWPGIDPSKKAALDVRLAFGAVAGTPVLLNDGYLILNPACFESLKNANSPLRVLINQGYIRVLSRNTSHSLSQVVTDGAGQGIASYRDLKNQGKKWAATQKVLDNVQPDLKHSFCEWPNVDLPSSYLRLIQLLSQVPHGQRGINTPDAVFKDVVKQFEDELSGNRNRPRSRWEAIVKKLGQNQFQELMELGNEVYHHNFGVALSAFPPKNLPNESEIAVQTRVSQVFMELLYKTHKPKISLPDSIPPQLTLPGALDYSNGSWLVPLFVPEQPLGKARAAYLNVRTRYLEGAASGEEMTEATSVYQKHLNEHLALFPHKKAAGHFANAAVSSVPVALAVAGIVTGSAPTIVIAIVAFFATEYGVPVVTEKWRTPFREKGLDSARWSHASASRSALTALAVDRDQAQKITADIPAFGGTA
jgi:hypothetical protein